MKTASWFTPLPDDHIRIGISRGVPRRQAAGYRVFRQLAPGPWFNSVDAEEYYRRYRAEILAPLDPRTVAAELTDLAGGRIPVLVCYERPGAGDWCHRAMAAEWLAAALGRTVPELGYETLPQHQHPLMPPGLSQQPSAIEVLDVTPYIGRRNVVDGVEYRVIGADPRQPGRAIVSTGASTFSAGPVNLRRYFPAVGAAGAASGTAPAR
jgi:hypothetical protein